MVNLPWKQILTLSALAIVWGYMRWLQKNYALFHKQEEEQEIQTAQKEALFETNAVDGDHSCNACADDEGVKIE